MAKVKTTFFCQNCGSQYTKWQGQCNACKEWNTIVEEVIQTPEKSDLLVAEVLTQQDNENAVSLVKKKIRDYKNNLMPLNNS